MKKLTILLIIVFLFSVSLTQAQNKPEKVIELQKQIQIQEKIGEEKQFQNQESVKNEIKLNNQIETKFQFEKFKEEIKKEKDISKAKNLENRFLGREQALNRFNLAIERMENLKNKVSEIIIKHEANGLNVLEAKNLITEVETKISLAKEKTLSAYELLSESTNKLTTEEKDNLQNLAKEIQTLVKEMRAQLNGVIKTLKIALKESLINSNTENEVKEEIIVE